MWTYTFWISREMSAVSCSVNALALICSRWCLDCNSSSKMFCTRKEPWFHTKKDFDLYGRMLQAGRSQMAGPTCSLFDCSIISNFWFHCALKAWNKIDKLCWLCRERELSSTSLYILKERSFWWRISGVVATFKQDLGLSPNFLLLNAVLLFQMLFLWGHGPP